MQCVLVSRTKVKRNLGSNLQNNETKLSSPSHRSIFFVSRVYRMILSSHWSSLFVLLFCKSDPSRQPEPKTSNRSYLHSFISSSRSCNIHTQLYQLSHKGVRQLKRKMPSFVNGLTPSRINELKRSEWEPPLFVLTSTLFR